MKEKTADEMFEELGYTKFYDRENACVFYDTKTDKKIIFDKTYKSIELSKDTGESIYNNTIYDIFILEINELQAINKKIEELGWNEKS